MRSRRRGRAAHPNRPMWSGMAAVGSELADDLAAEYTQSSELHGVDGPDTTWTTRYPGG
jgi:hypothetical protein